MLIKKLGTDSTAPPRDQPVPEPKTTLRDPMSPECSALVTSKSDNQRHATSICKIGRQEGGLKELEGTNLMMQRHEIIQKHRRASERERERKREREREKVKHFAAILAHHDNGCQMQSQSEYADASFFWRTSRI